MPTMSWTPSLGCWLFSCTVRLFSRFGADVPMKSLHQDSAAPAAVQQKCTEARSFTERRVKLETEAVQTDEYLQYICI